MSGSQTTKLWLALAVIFIGCAVLRFVQARRYHARYRYPNLVPGLPIIGNAHQVPSEHQVLHFQKLAQQYGEMFTLRFASTYWVFLNSSRVVEELLEKRAAVYSSRHELPMAQELLSQGHRMLLMPYGEDWRRQRKVMHQILNNTQHSIFEPCQDVESRALLYQYLRNPEAFAQATERFANSVIMNVTFGRRTEIGDPDLAVLLENFGEFVKYLSPGRSVVDVIPVLGRLTWLKSLQPWRWYGDRLYRRTLEVYKKEVVNMRERQQSGTQKPCFLSEFFDRGKDKDFTEEEIYFIGGTLMEAGSDTTRTSLHIALAGAALWPDWVVRAREELDEVCGANAERLPEFADMNKLRVIKGAVKESLRWKPGNAPSGVPHCLTRDDEFEGYRLPAGTVVTWNNWAIANSAEEYEQPQRFWPERFMNEDLDKPLKGHYTFGAGRRACVGYSVGYNNLLISLARIVYCFDLTEVPDHPLNILMPYPAVGSPFKIDIKIRSEAHRALVERACKDASIL